MTMTRTAAQSCRAQCKKGFTLTEIAIVLGIIGLILGAVWTAASGVYASTNAGNFSQSMGQYVAAVRAACNNSCTALPTVTAGIPTVPNWLGTAQAGNNGTGVSTTVPGDIVLEYTMPGTLNKYATAVYQGLQASANTVGAFFGPGTDATAPPSPTCTGNNAITCVAPAGYVSQYSGGSASQCTGNNKPANPTGNCSLVYSGTITAGTNYTFGFPQSF